VVLPNSPNVIMAAERAAELSDKHVVVVRATSQQAGLAAAVALVPEHGVGENAKALEETLARVRTGAVAEAARDDAQGRFARGEAVGFVEDDVIAWGEPGETLRQVLEVLGDDRAGATEVELITVLAGIDAPLDEAAIGTLLNGNGGSAPELELRHGGQSAYWWLLAAE
jgi:dihydroxyacetone kinase-like predicted kinase